MSVVSVKEKLGSGQGEENDKGEMTFRRSFVVTTSTWQDGPVTILRNGKIPQIGQGFSRAGEGNGAVCNRRSATPDANSPKVWNVDCEYGPTPMEGGGEAGGDPGQFPVTEISVGHSLVMRPIEVDARGKVIANSSGELFIDPAPMLENVRTTVSIKRFEPEGNRIQSARYVNTCNSKWFWNVWAYHIKCQMIRGIRRVEELAGVFWEVEYEFHIDPLSWVTRILDKGKTVTKGKTGSQHASGTSVSPGDLVNKSVEATTDALNNVLRHEVLLNGEGGVLKVGQKPVWLEYHFYDERDFNELRLPKLWVAVSAENRFQKVKPWNPGQNIAARF